MRNHRLPILAGALLLSSSTAFAAPIDFSTFGVGDLGHSIVVGGVTVAAFSVTASGGATPTFSGSLTDQHLFGRNEAPGDLGIGVCSSLETCGSGSGLGDANENSNESVQELIRMTLPVGSSWLSLSLSSLDLNGDKNVPERAMLFGSNSANPAGATPLLNFTGTGNGALANQGPFDLSGPTFQYTYLFVVPWDHTGNGLNDNDFLLWKLEVAPPGKGGDVPVPEPATLTLLGLGMAAGAVRRRLQKKN